MIRKLTAATFLLAILALTAFAQQKTDFSGTWKLNVSKSDFGPLPAPTARTDVITQKEPMLTDVVSAETADGKLAYTVNYSTDGQETTNHIGEREQKSTAKWDGANLVIHSKFNFNDMAIDATATWTISADGKTLTISAHFVASMGEADQKFIYEKQEDAAPAKN
jgi:hypothetical protein